LRDTIGAHLQGSKACDRQGTRAETQPVSAVVTCTVPGQWVFYSFVVSV